MNLKWMGRLCLLICLVTSSAFSSMGDETSVKTLLRVIANFRILVNEDGASGKEFFKKRTMRNLFTEDTEYIALIQRDMDCPIGARSTPYLKDLVANKVKGVRYYLINYQWGDQKNSVQNDRQKNKFAGLSYLSDPTQGLAKLLEVDTTTEMIILDRSYQVRYRGPVNNRFSIGTTKEGHQDLMADYLAKLRKNRDAAPEKYPAPGCFLSYRSTVATADKKAIDPASWSEIKPLLVQKCMRCHQTETLSGIRLNSLEDFAKHSRLAQYVVEKKIMPPLDINKDSRPTKLDYNLGSEDRAKLLRWLQELPNMQVDDKPIEEKSLAKKAAPIEYDYNLSLIENLEIPAKGNAYYKFFYVKSPFETDKYITSAEMELDDSLRSTHHVIIRIVKSPPPQGQDPMRIEGNYLGGYTPGSKRLQASDDGAILFPKGSYLFVIAHFTPNGQAHKNSLRVKLKFTEDPQRQKNLYESFALLKTDFVIPRNSRKEMSEEFVVPADMRLYTLFPHFHYRGRRVRVWLIRKNTNKKVMLLGLDTFYYHNQVNYDFVEPVSLKAGDRLLVKFYYDNTADNVFNPDPTVDVYHGPADQNEMFYFTMRWIKE